jgi:hypothetical protein
MSRYSLANNTAVAKNYGEGLKIAEPDRMGYAASGAGRQQVTDIAISSTCIVANR